MTSGPSITERLEALEKQFSEVESDAAQKDADNKRLLKENGEQAEEIRNLKAQIAWFQRQMFGRNSEKRDPYEGQPSLFPELDTAPVVPDTPEPGGEESDKEWRRRKRQVRKMTEDLPVLEREVIGPEGADPALYRKIGE